MKSERKMIVGELKSDGSKAFILRPREPMTQRPHPTPDSKQQVRQPPEVLIIDKHHYIRVDGAHEPPFHNEAHKISQQFGERGHYGYSKGSYSENNGIYAIATTEGKVFVGYSRPRSGEYMAGSHFVPFSNHGGLNFYLNEETMRVRDNFPHRLYRGEVTHNEYRKLLKEAQERHPHDVEQAINWAINQMEGSNRTHAPEPAAYGVKQPLSSVHTIKTQEKLVETLHQRIGPLLEAEMRRTELSAAPNKEWVLEQIKSMGLSNATDPKIIKKDIKKILLKIHPDRFKPEKGSHTYTIQHRVLLVISGLFDFLK